MRLSKTNTLAIISISIAPDIKSLENYCVNFHRIKCNHQKNYRKPFMSGTYKNTYKVQTYTVQNNSQGHMPGIKKVYLKTVARRPSIPISLAIY